MTSDETRATAKMSDLKLLLADLVEKGGSDLHLVSEGPPRIRVDGRVLVLDEPPLTSNDIEQFVEEFLSLAGADSKQGLLRDRDTRNYSFGLDGVGRFRCHLYRQRGTLALVIRSIPLRVPSFKNLGLPLALGELTRKSRGLVIVTGPSGCGKSTTLAALVDKINEERRCHIVTLEQPIEFLHDPKRGFLSQREIGVDVAHVSSALQDIPRESPDVVMLGGIENHESTEAALTLAESGHLLLMTLSGASCLQVIQRIVNAVPPPQQHHIRHRLAQVLEGIVSQTLVPKFKAPGRALAVEILIPTSAVRRLIREDKIQQIYSVMQTGQAKHGMQTLNQALVDLCRRRTISVSTAFAHSLAPDELQHMLQRNPVKREA